MLANKNLPETKKILGKDFSNLGIVLSILFHLFVIVFVSFSLTKRDDLVLKEQVYSVEILPISQKSNIKSTTKEEKSTNLEEKEEKEEVKSSPKKEEQKKEVPDNKKDSKQEDSKEDTTIQKDKEETKQETKPLPSDKKPEPKKEEKKQQPKKPKPPSKKEQAKDDNFDSLMKTLEKKSSPKKGNSAAAKKTAKGTFNDNLPLSISLEDDIRRQIESCWTPPAGGMDAGKLNILLQISLERDGTVTSVKVLEKPKTTNAQIASAATDAAVRAVKKCSPLQNLPEEQYETWKELEFYFDPSKMIY
jgi:outer membrane biosynthesis protein TonB